MKKNGTVQIKDGKFIVTDPEVGGKLAVVIPPQYGEISVNGQIKKGQITVRSSDDILYIHKNKPIYREINIDVKENNMKAYMSINYEDEIAFKIKDSAKIETLQIELEEVERYRADLFTEKDLQNEIKKRGIITGVNVELVRLISQRYGVRDILIAEGIAPVNPVDDYVVFLYDEENKAKGIDNNEDINYREINKIHSVKSGDMIGTVVSGVDPEDGTNVYGNPVTPKIKKRKVIQEGNGCKIIGNIIIATKSGLVNYNKEKVTVAPIYNCNGDVDIKHGNINFDGIVNIAGSVSEAMKITALDSVEVKGGVYRAEINSEGDIVVGGNTVSSNLTSGNEKLNLYELICSLKGSEKLLSDILNLLNSNPVYSKAVGAAIKVLLETKYLDRMIIFNNLSENKMLNEELRHIIKNKLKVNKGAEIKTVNELKDIIEKINEELIVLENMSIELKNVTITNCQESTIKSSGNIFINGKGVFTSNLYALDSIIFNDERSICRGGHIKAKNKIKIATVGSPAGGRTVLEVIERNGKIEIGTAYENTMIIINNKTYVVTKSIKEVQCYLNEAGEIIVDKLIL